MRDALGSLARRLALAAFAIAALSASGCANDGAASNRDPGDDPRRDWQQLPGFTPFSS